MLLHSERIGVTSAASAAVVRQALRTAGAEWRESQRSDLARAAHILGWKVRTPNDRVVVRARISGQSGFLPHFVGRLRDVPTGSVIDGELRLSWLPRVFMLIWLTLAGGAPFIALLEPVPHAGIGDHLLSALLMLLPATGLFFFGRWLVRHHWRARAAAFQEFLNHACETAVTVSHVERDV